MIKHRIVTNKDYGTYWVCIGHCCDMHHKHIRGKDKW